MCGVAGAVEYSASDAQRAVNAMCAQMIARGPDDGGVLARQWVGGALSLGNRRLAIIDPSHGGHQPMIDEARGNVLVFNGMVYNYRELRQELIGAGERFATDSDTEVVLKAYGQWGEECVQHLRGMFAFAVHDASRCAVFLARDRIGVKPLYYWQQGERFLFASQVKALLAAAQVPPHLSLEGVRGYLATGAVPEPLTAIEGVRALPAGHTATLYKGDLEIRRYWSLSPGLPAPPPGTGAALELRRRLGDIVEQHLVSDAALGVFLSGGLDSSLLAALASRHHPDLRTVGIVFEDEQYSEASFIERVVAQIGTQHTQAMVSSDFLRDGLPAAFSAMDQPTFDGINTWLVSRVAEGAGLKVALSGLGADELFDGYGHAARVAALEATRRAPALTRPLLAGAARALPGASGRKTAAWLRGDVVNANALLRGLFLPRDVSRLAGHVARADVECVPGQSDLDGYTRDVLLRDTDAMSMAHSLEVRVPYLDHELVEWARSLSPSTIGRRKQLLRAAARGIVPDEVIDRPKQGFVLPLARWMRGDLRDEIEPSLRDLPAPLRQLLDRDEVMAVWRQFQRDGRDWLRPWSLYALSQWARTIDVPQRVAVAA